MDNNQSEGRKHNGAEPGGKPDAHTSSSDVKKTGHHESESAGPDGPDASEVGETFKHAPGDAAGSQ